MKIKITYETEEQLQQALNSPLQSLISTGAKVRKSDRHAPFYHLYIEVRNPNKARNGGENAGYTPG